LAAPYEPGPRTPATELIATIRLPGRAIWGRRARDVAELACRVDVFHVAAHGRHSAENPLFFSGLELVDGPWFGYDIDQLARSHPQ